MFGGVGDAVGDVVGGVSNAVGCACGGVESMIGGAESPASKLALAMIIISIILLIVGFYLTWEQMIALHKGLLLGGALMFGIGVVLYKFTSPKKD